MILIDVHAHLDAQEFNSDLDVVIKKAKDFGLKIIISNGLNPKSNKQVLEISKKYDVVKPALGFYPTDCENASNEEFEYELKKIKTSKPIAVGEVGLDKQFVVDFEKQKLCFEKLITLSKELDVPLIIHSRKAEVDCIEILNKHECRKVVMHMFSGNKKLVEQVIKNGWYFSIPANLSRSEHFKMVVDMTPLRQLLTETDSPLMAPNLGERNEPANVAGTINEIAKIKAMDKEEVANIIFSNYQRLFL